MVRATGREGNLFRSIRVAPGAGREGRGWVSKIAASGIEPGGTPASVGFCDLVGPHKLEHVGLTVVRARLGGPICVFVGVSLYKAVSSIVLAWPLFV